MTITKNMILYFIRDMGITILGETKTEQQFAGIKHWIPEREDLSDEYLYLCDGAHIPEKTQILSQTVCMLVIFSQKEAGQKNQEQRKKWRQFHNNLICIETEKSVPEVMNALVEIFYRLVEWDKNMHIVALEGKDVQELIDISESVLEYPMIVFDASFDVLAYTKHCESHYKTFWETVPIDFFSSPKRFVPGIRSLKIKTFHLSPIKLSVVSTGQAGSSFIFSFMIKLLHSFFLFLINKFYHTSCIEIKRLFH